ncbi:hypothetical protein BT96DRAFT_15080 [Gymnopus androsaceus JB14]|uniref:Methyltransferase domain-containing protein n=1 Tax=Gymnopus androsaceus JB14 TaxID=1447944 RepID=A0A6A4ISE5_9AGAR|nr:hypothetical protein BT96DRAFT_15080 [Gymnopus androsaceus JB14]
MDECMLWRDLIFHTEFNRTFNRTNPYRIFVVDASLYRLSPEEFAFFSNQTGITDEEELKNHIIAVATQAFDMTRYPCIGRFLFLSMSGLPTYPHLLDIGRELKNPIFLDIGCCFGVDVRKAIVDGFPAQNIIASDLCPEFWEFGHALFQSTPSSFPVAFVPGDIFDDSFIDLNGPTCTGDSPLNTVKSLHELTGRINAIHVSRLFHLFTERQQLELAHRLAKLLSPSPGSMIFGQHRGSDVPGVIANALGETSFDHSPDSWKTLWNGVVFPEGTVEVNCVLRPATASSIRGTTLDWSVIRT